MTAPAAPKGGAADWTDPSRRGAPPTGLRSEERATREGGGSERPGGSRQQSRRRVKAPRRPKAVLLVVGVVLLGGILVALLTPPRPPSGYLDPANPAGQGTRALAQILGRRGQPVIPVTSAAAAQDAVRDAPGSHPGLVLTSPYLLTAGQLASLVRMHTNLLVVEPDSRSLAALAQLPRAAARAGRTAYPDTQGGRGHRRTAGPPGLPAAGRAGRRGRRHGRRADAGHRAGRLAVLPGGRSLVAGALPVRGPVGHPARQRAAAEQRGPGQPG